MTAVDANAYFRLLSLYIDLHFKKVELFMNFPDMHFEQENYFEAWLISEQRIEYVLVSNGSDSLNIISNCASLGNIIKNPNEKHDIHVKSNRGLVRMRFKHKAFELNTSTHQQPPAFFSIVNFTYIAAQES